MPWFLGERRGPHWKQRWRALDSLSLPPAPLVAVFAIVLLFLWLPSHAGRRCGERVEIGLRLLLLLVPLVLVFVARWMFVEGRFVLRLPSAAEQDAIHRAGSSPWGVATLVVVLLLMVSFHSSIESLWFRPLWWRYS